MPTTRLTAAAVERLRPPQEGRADHRDGVVPGLALRITHTGSKSWSLHYRVAGENVDATGKPKRGKLRRLTLGAYPLLDLTEARARAREALRLADEGVDPVAERERRLTDMHATDGRTVRAVAEQFIEKYARPRNKSWRDTQRLLDTFVVARWGDKPIDAVTRSDVHRLLDDMGSTYRTNVTFAAVHKLFNWCLERGYVEHSPAAGIRKPKAPQSRERVLTDDELRAAWRAAGDVGYPFGTLVKLLLATGQRRDEVAKMKWGEVTDLDGADPTLTIPRERYKQGRNQEVPLSSLAVDILADAPRWRGPFVLSTTGGEKPSSNYGKNKTKLDEKMLAHLREVDPDAELTPWRLHDLRRTVGTNLARLGVPVHTISRVLGHAQGGVTAIYDRHSYAPEKRDALERWATKLRTIVDDQVVDLATERGRRA